MAPGDTLNAGPYAAIWIAIAILFLWLRWKRRTPGVGLVAAYLVSFWAIHWVASAAYTFPWYEKPYFSYDLVTLGLRESTYGVLSFAIGSLALAPHLKSGRSAGSFVPLRSLPVAYMIVGAGFYLMASTFFAELPTVSSLVSAGQYLFIVGLCLALWQAAQKRNSLAVGRCLAVTAALPLVTILTRGFMGYGATAALVVLTFFATLTRSLWKLVVLALIVLYIGMSFYVTYMRDRSEIRDVVWGGKDYSNRFEQLLDTVATLEWFDPFSEKHLLRVDRRLNQNHLVGAAVETLAVNGDYAYGDTLLQALVAPIPRIMWPDKPVFAGSPELVSRYTGLTFAEGTSVGVGQVMEFYINFGRPGVIVGFLLMGMVVTLIDVTARRCLVVGDWQGFGLWYLAGLGCLQIGGSLVEVFGTTAASVVLALVVNRQLLKGFQKKASRARAFGKRQPASF